MNAPKRFLNNPKDIQPEVEQLVKEAEKEEVKQEEIVKEIEKVENPPQSVWWWVRTIVFWSIITYFVVVNIFSPIATRFKYGGENKENSDELKIYKKWTEEQIAKDKENRITTLCSKITDLTKVEECEGVSLPTSTPTPTVKVAFPTQAP